MCTEAQPVMCSVCEYRGRLNPASRQSFCELANQILPTSGKLPYWCPRPENEDYVRHRRPSRRPASEFPHNDPGERERISKRLRKLLERNPCCVYCATRLTFRNVTQDHRIPLSRGGGRGARGSNIAACCWRCNQRKGSMTETEYLLLLSQERREQWQRQGEAS